MNYFRSTVQHGILFVRPAMLALTALLTLALASCDQMSDLVDKAKGLFGDDEKSASTTTGVDEVNEKEAKEVMAKEPRLVMVEFYTDT